METASFAPQGSPEWHRQRLGMVTASKFKDMMTNSRGKDTMGQTALSYMWDLIAEIVTQTPQDEVNNRAIEWGNDNEPQARAMYCFKQNVRVIQTGFLVHADYPRVGGSPDGLVEGDPDGPGGVEIKCPMRSRIHLKYLYEGGVPKDYQMQVQGLMWVTGRSWWDFVSFDPRMPDHLQLYVYRDRASRDLQIDLERRTQRFIEQMEVKLKKLEQL